MQDGLKEQRFTKQNLDSRLYFYGFHVKGLGRAVMEKRQINVNKILRGEFMLGCKTTFPSLVYFSTKGQFLGKGQTVPECPSANISMPILLEKTGK